MPTDKPLRLPRNSVDIGYRSNPIQNCSPHYSHQILRYCYKGDVSCLTTTDNKDWPYRNGPPQPTTLDISADNTKDVYRCFVTATKELNDAKIVYALLGYNSNSYVRAILINVLNFKSGTGTIPCYILQLVILEGRYRIA